MKCNEVDGTPWTRHGEASKKNQRKGGSVALVNFHFRGFGGKISNNWVKNKY